MADLLTNVSGSGGASNGYGTWGSQDVSNPWGVNGFTFTNAYNSAEAINADRRAFQMQQQAQAYNSSEAVKQRDYEKMMSDTAVQRSVGDYKAAGFSPLAALGNSASTPSGAVAHSESGGGHAAHASNSGLLGGVLSLIGSLITKGMSSAAKVAASASSAAISGALNGHSAADVAKAREIASKAPNKDWAQAEFDYLTR